MRKKPLILALFALLVLGVPACLSPSKGNPGTGNGYLGATQLFVESLGHMTVTYDGGHVYLAASLKKKRQKQNGEWEVLEDLGFRAATFKTAVDVADSNFQAALGGSSTSVYLSPNYEGALDKVVAFLGRSLKTFDPSGSLLVSIDPFETTSTANPVIATFSDDGGAAGTSTSSLTYVMTANITDLTYQGTPASKATISVDEDGNLLNLYPGCTGFPPSETLAAAPALISSGVTTNAKRIIAAAKTLATGDVYLYSRLLSPIPAQSVCSNMITINLPSGYVVDSATSSFGQNPGGDMGLYVVLRNATTNAYSVRFILLSGNLDTLNLPLTKAPRSVAYDFHTGDIFVAYADDVSRYTGAGAAVAFKLMDYLK